MRGYRDLVGRTDLVGGYGEADGLFGADLVVGAPLTAQQSAAMQQLALRNSTGVVETPPTRSRRWPLGFPNTSIAATNGTGSPSAQPQILFRGERLVIPSDFAGDLFLTNITVGQASQFAASNPVPCRAFTEYGWGVDLYLDTADVSQLITLNLTNTSSHAISFYGVILGRSVA